MKMTVRTSVNSHFLNTFLFFLLKLIRQKKCSFSCESLSKSAFVLKLLEALILEMTSKNAKSTFPHRTFHAFGETGGRGAAKHLLNVIKDIHF